MESQNLNKQEKLPSVAQSNALTVGSSQEQRTQIAEMVAQCFDALSTYGKQPEQLTNTVKMFVFVLGDYTADKIVTAFKLHLQRSRDMPTPADIVAIIRRGNKPPLDKSVYVSLCQKRERTAWRHGEHSWQRGDALTDEEAEYIKEYERDSMGKTE